MKNMKIARILYEVAELLELQGDLKRARAYNRASQTIRGWKQEMKELYQQRGLEGLDEIPGVGERIAKMVEELLRTGQLRYLKKLRKEGPPLLVELVRIPGVGPKTAKFLVETLKVETIDELEHALRSGRLTGLKGIGPKTIQNLLEGIQIYRQSRERD